MALASARRAAAARSAVNALPINVKHAAQRKQHLQHANIARKPSNSVVVNSSTEQPQVTKNLDEGYDVYVYEPQPLAEGVEKHIISVFVADESGLINRVAGVFARRGANIESLAVGLTVDKALFTIVVTGTASTVSNLVKQLAKLVKVRYVEDVTKANRVERELVLMKLRVPPGPARVEVLQLAEIFRARVVDVGDDCLTLCVSGDSGKCLAIERAMAKFGIVEIARTGRVCLKRGDDMLEPRWSGDARKTQEAPGPHPAAVSANTAAATAVPDTRRADVYSVDESEPVGVWEVENILEATYQDDPNQCFSAYTLSIEVQDVPGVLNQVTQVFARRGYNVQSLAVGPSEREGMSRITTVLPGTGAGVQNLVKQLKKLIAVQSVTDITDMPFVSRELLLVKVRCTAAQRGELRDLVQIFRGSIIDISQYTMTIELTGKEDKMKAMTDLLEAYGIMEIARTGRVALMRESGVDVKFLETRSYRKVW